MRSTATSFGRAKPMGGLRCISVLGLVLAIAAPLCAQPVRPESQDTVSISASRMPLSAILRALGAIRPFDQLVVDSQIEATSVTVEIQGVSVPNALKAVLDAAEGIDYVLSATADGRRMRLIAVKAGSGKHLQSPTATASTLAANISDAPEAAGQRNKSATEESTTEPDDPGKNDMSVDATRDLEAVLTRSPSARAPGSVVVLPFPGADGAPLTSVLPMAPLPAAPGATTRTRLTAPVPVSPSDPTVKGLFDALVGTRKPER